MNAAVATVDNFFRRNRGLLLLLLPLLAIVYATIFPGMVEDWSNDPNYSHGFLIPVIAGYFLWQSRDELLRAEVRPANSGLLLILFALALLVFGLAGTEYFTMRSSFVFLLAGLVLYLFGWQVLKIAALPIGFLFFMVPLPYIVYDAIAFPLKLLVAKFSVLALKAAGVIVMREGNIIMFPHITLEVADACSGLRSLMSLMALSVAFAFFSQKTWGKRLVLIASAVPIALFTNMVRVIVTGFLAQYYGSAAAEGFFHEFAGLAVFGMAMVLLLFVGAFLRKYGKCDKDLLEADER